MNIKKKLEQAKTIADVFELVKRIIQDCFGVYQAGLLVGLSDLDTNVGAFYSLNANTIVLNKKHLLMLKHTNPLLYKPYLFHILLHEYIHSLGIFDESQVRSLTYQLTEKYFSKTHLTTKIAADINSVITNITFKLPQEASDISIEYVHGIDKDNTTYIT